MTTEQEYRAHVTRTAEAVRDSDRAATAPVLTGKFDRFIVALARMVAFDLHREYGSVPEMTVAELEHWHGDARSAITSANFIAMCSAHGIPQEIVLTHSIAGADHFDRHYRKYLGELFGWVSTS